MLDSSLAAPWLLHCNCLVGRRDWRKSLGVALGLVLLLRHDSGSLLVGTSYTGHSSLIVVHIWNFSCIAATISVFIIAVGDLSFGDLVVEKTDVYRSSVFDSLTSRSRRTHISLNPVFSQPGFYGDAMLEAYSTTYVSNDCDERRTRRQKDSDIEFWKGGRIILYYQVMRTGKAVERRENIQNASSPFDIFKWHIAVPVKC